MPFVGLTGGMGSGKSTALRCCGRSAPRCSRATPSCTSSTKDEQLRDAVVARFGAEVAPGGVVDRAAVAAAGVRVGGGSRVARGAGVAAGGRAGGGVAGAGARACARRRARRWSRCRCCSRRAWIELYDATIAVVADESVRSAGAARAGTRWSTSARRASSRRRRRRDGRRSWCATTAAWRISSASCRRCLASLEDEPRRRLCARSRAIVVTVLFVGVGRRRSMQQATRNLALPLSDASIIREQAAEKRLDPALIAAVIYAETKFDPRPSPAGAEGLMQILPSTAYYLARLSGGSELHRQRSRGTRASTSPTAATTCAICSTTTAATRCSRWPRTTAA